jgi:biofilm PGA synthesis N-glycosyltransferase PgaC
MVNLVFIYVIPFTVLLLIFILAYLDKRKKRHLVSHPFISFILPCYNDAKDVEDAVKSIYQSYDNFELFIINDKSTDNSLDILTELQKKYKFTLINNKENLGKSKSINLTVPKTKGEIIFGVDSDVVLTKEAVKEILTRFDSDKKVAAVSCPYKPKNTGFLASMQDIEYMQIKMVKYSQNPFSVLGAWGGCLAVKRKPFLEVGMFSENALVEDMDLALKLTKKGYRVEQSSVSVKSDVPSTFKAWFKQKIRWNSGGTQCFLTYPKLYLKNPIVLLFGFSNLLLIITLAFFFYKYLFSFYTIAETVLSFAHPLKSSVTFLEYLYAVDKTIILHTIFVKLGFMIFVLPYLIMLIKSPKDSYKIIYIIPYTIIYGQLSTIVYISGWFAGIKKYFELKNSNKRAW